MSASSDNKFFHNNFVDNTMEVYIPFPGDPSFWNDTLEGNYWSDYAGSDLNRDGIGDSAHVIDANNRDNFPLMGLFNSFNTSLSYHVNVISNSTIDDFEFFKSPANITIKMHVSNMTLTQTAGLCRVCIPHVLMTEIYNVTIEGAAPHHANYTLYNNGTHGWIYFNYNHSILEVIIQGLDNEPPIIDIIAPENKTYSSSDVALSFFLYEPTSWIGYSLDEQANVTISGNTTLIGLSDGVHTMTLFANDTAGNMGHSNTVNFTVDTLPPNILILSPENKSYITSSIFLNFTINEATSWIGYSLDGQMNQTVSGNTTLTGLSDQAHTITVYANDTAGNMGYSAMVYFTVDTVSVSISILSPENKTYAMNSVPLSFTINKEISWIGYSLDDQTNVTIAGNTTLTDLLDGSHYVIVYANDTFGDMGSSNMVYFTVDSTPPNITVVSQIPPEDNVLPVDEVRVNATVTDDLSTLKRVTLNYTINNGTWFSEEMTNFEGNIWNATIPAFPYCTNVNYTIIAEDDVGNTITTEEMEYKYHVIPEFPSLIILPLFMITTLLAIIVYRRKRMM